MKKIIILFSFFWLSIFSFVSAYNFDEITAANKLAEEEIINNHSDDIKKYNLDNYILRQEMAAITRKLAWIEKANECKSIFEDVSNTKPNNWACKNIEPLVENWFLSKNKLFNPEKNISKTEALAMIVRAIWKSEYKKDETSEKNWQEQLVDFAVKNKIIENFTDYNKEATRWWIFNIANKAKEIKEKMLLDTLNKESKLISDEVKIKKYKEFIDIFNPGTCIWANSQCNFCTRENSEEDFICTEAFCENEEFQCNEYE